MVWSRPSFRSSTGRRALGVWALCVAASSGSVLLASGPNRAEATRAPTTPTGPSTRIVAEFGAPGVLATGQHTVVLTQRSGAGATLFVGVDGATPAVLPGVGALPSWAQPHVGTDSRRRRVIVYPRCSTADVRSCDLYRYDIDAATERPLPAVNTRDVGEVEGTMERGAIAFSRWTRQRGPQDGEHGATTTLLYRPAGGPTRLLTRRGGQQLALHGTRVLMVRDTEPTYGVCGRPSVQLLRLDGSRQVLRAYRCGMDAHHPMSPTFLGDRIVWAMLSVSQVAFSQWNVPAQQVLTQRLAVAAPEAYAPVTWSRALVLTPQYSTSSLSWSLVSASNITPG